MRFRLVIYKGVTLLSYIHVLFTQESGRLEERAMVMGVLDKAFDILVLNLGVVKRVYLNVS